MTTILANPIYDAAFKFLMEDQEVAKYVLSAFLQKEVVKVEMRNTEYVTLFEQYNLKLFRLDFTAIVLNKDGAEQHVIIELQKAAADFEVQRFRRYLGSEYTKFENEDKNEKKNEKKNKRSHYEPPIISIYILGHLLKQVRRPIIYVKRVYFDDENNIIDAKDPFIESLTHDSIIIQVPLLKKGTKDPLNKVLRFFKQEKKKHAQTFVEFNLEEMDLENDKASAAIANRLIRAAVTPKVKQQLEVEEEIVSELMRRDFDLMEKDLMIKQKEQVLEEKEQEIEQKDQEIEQKDQEIEQKDQEIEQKDQVIAIAVLKLANMGITNKEISEILSIPEEEVKKLGKTY